jgi:hypothetical protein
MAAKHSPHPWHVRLGGYRVGLAIRDTIPQWLADSWTDTMQLAVLAWAKGRMITPSLDYIDDLDDEMVKRRIAGYQKGYDKEYYRRADRGLWSDFDDQAQERYVFADMSMSLQRAIVSRWDADHAQWMREHYQVHYTPEFGYHWRINFEDVTVKIKMHSSDAGNPPSQEESEGWEAKGYPGGMVGWSGTAGSRESYMLWLYVEGVEPPDLRVEGIDRE